MTVFQFFGGLVLFGLLWFIFPRTSFAVVLSLYLMRVHGVNLFPYSGVEFFVVVATIFFIFVGFIGGLVLDVAEHRRATWDW